MAIIKNGADDVAAYSLDSGASINTTDKNESTPLHSATFSGREPTKDGSMPLDLAASHGHKSIATMLRSHGHTLFVNVDVRM
jgi:ankyrin repeat protein